MEDDKKPFLALSGDTLKSVVAMLAIITTLFGGTRFAVSKIDEYDGYSTRLAKLEARDQAVTALSEAAQKSAFQIEINKNDMAALKVRIDNMAADIVTLRLSYERVKTLLEARK